MLVVCVCMGGEEGGGGREREDGPNEPPFVETSNKVGYMYVCAIERSARYALLATVQSLSRIRIHVEFWISGLFPEIEPDKMNGSCRRASRSFLGNSRELRNSDSNLGRISTNRAVKITYILYAFARMRNCDFAYPYIITVLDS